VLVRIAYAADLPPPDEVIRQISEGAARPAPARMTGGAPASAPVASAEPMRQPAPAPRTGLAQSEPARGETVRGEPVRSPSRPTLASGGMAQPRDPVVRPAEATQGAPALAFSRFADLIAFAHDKRDLPLKTLLERDVRLVHFEDGKIEIALEPSASRALIGDLGRKLSALTGRRWMVVVSTEQGEPTVKSQADARRNEFMAGVQSDPVVQNVLARFPGAQIVAVREPERSLAPPPPAVPVDDDEPAPDMPPYEDESAFGAHRRTDDVDDDF
jgi:DNA polymerase-3 subunit gamma/tau